MGPPRRVKASRLMSAPFGFATRTPLRRALPGTLPRRPARIKRIGALRPPAKRNFVAILPVALARHQAIPRIDHFPPSIQPEALGDGGPGSPATFVGFKIARVARELPARLE